MIGRAALVGLALVAGQAAAEADGPDAWRVVDVPAGETLAMRGAPTADAPVIALIPADAAGLANFGCVGGLSFAEWEQASQAERAAGRLTRWCKVGYERSIGWVAGVFLAEGYGDAFTGGAFLQSLAGSKWQLSALGGVTVAPLAEPPWIAFRADGTAYGHTGCNAFKARAKRGSGRLDLGPIAVTRKACPVPAMEIEAQVLAALGAAESVAAAQHVLALFGPDGALLATFDRQGAD